MARYLCKIWFQIYARFYGISVKSSSSNISHNYNLAPVYLLLCKFRHQRESERREFSPVQRRKTPPSPARTPCRAQNLVAKLRLKNRALYRARCGPPHRLCVDYNSEFRISNTRINNNETIPTNEAPKGEKGISNFANFWTPCTDRVI